MTGVHERPAIGIDSTGYIQWMVIGVVAAVFVLTMSAACYAERRAVRREYVVTYNVELGHVDLNMG